ncbi:MAG: winged helix-turn-helix transcriptional regulator [Hyphomonadaceae bacterium]|nr:winged helix-turn-helix transcriptional regulator [Hyphomonadaceae bacterium]
MKPMASAQKRRPQPPALILERFLPYRLSILSNRVSRAIAARYAKAFDLTIPEWRVIAVLGRTPGLSAKAVAEATEMDKVAVSRAIARLTAARRVVAEIDAADARRQLLWLTPQGDALHKRIAPLALETEQRLLAALAPRERAQLDALIDRLLETAQTL